MPILSNDEIAAAYGRPLSWWEKMGMWWYRATTPDQPDNYRGPASVGLGDAVMGGLGAVSEWYADTGPGQVGAAIGENVVNTAQVTTEAVVELSKPRWLILGAVVVGVLWAGPWLLRQSKSLKRAFA